jgi:D-serine deaminase-like pyridoxal phosphate-dependent protein
VACTTLRRARSGPRPATYLLAVVAPIVPAPTVYDLPTPALIVERGRLMANLARAQERAAAQGVALRPHCKTHRSVDIARLQLAGGARGITVATVDEASVFAAAGFDDILVAREVVSPAPLRRLAEIAAGGARVGFCVDTIAGANLASRTLAEAGVPLDVMVEVDTGHGRCGVPWDEPDAPGLVAHVGSLPGLRVRGLLTHAGHAYLGPREGETTDAALARVMEEERDRLLHLAVRLREAGALPSDAVLSVGSTPTFSRFVNRTVDGLRITEARPGNYVFHDAQQVALGSAGVLDCALTCQTTVTSLRRDEDGTERYFIDAGKKTLTSDGGWNVHGFGTLLYSPSTMVPNPHAAIVALSEEHGWIEVPGGAVHEIGDLARVVPNHACVSVATADRLYVVDGETVVDEWPVRGRPA